MPANKINPLTGEILVNTIVTKGQQNATAAYLSDGRFVVTWSDGSASGGFPFVLKAQLFDSSGNKSGGEFVVNDDSGDHQHPSLTALSTGGFVAIWMGGSFGYQTRFQIFDSSMNKVGSVVTAQNPLFAIGSASFPDVTALADGNFVIAWTDTDQGNPQGASYVGTFAQTFSPTGAAVDTAHLVNATTLGEQSRPSVAGLASGGHVVVWQDHPTATSADPNVPHDIKARLYASDGTPAAEFLVNTTTAGDQKAPEVARLAGGGFVVVWTDTSATGGDTSGSSIRAQVHDEAGNRIGGEILVNGSTAGDQYGARVAALPSGAFIIAWSDAGPEFVGDTDGSIRGQVFNGDGSRKGDEGIVNAQATSEFDLVIDVHADGSYALSWGEPDGTGFNDVKARFFAAVLDDPAVAQDDSVATTESSVGTGNVFADNGSGADSDPDGPGLSVAAVNGVGTDVGQLVTLASGATIIVNSDGTYSYDPNGKFNHLADASSGAVNTTASDSFTYALTNGNTATVSVTISGVASSGDILLGDGADNSITGSGFNESFMLQQGGDDLAFGLGGNDFFYFGAAMTGADGVDGGAGNDQIAIQGNYTLTFGSGLVNVESLIPLPGNDVRFGDSGTNFYDYALTAVDANLSAGQRLTVDANRLRAGEDFTFDGSAETNGNFFLIGGNGVDLLLGGAQSDTFLFGENGQFGASDVVNGGPGGTNDQLGLRGNYTIAFGAGQLIGLESIALVSSQDTRFGPLGSVFNYNLTMNDGNVAVGQLFTVDAAPLRSGETLTFNGSAETNGSYRVAGGAGNDSMIGGEQGDILIGRGGADAMTGGAGSDTYRYNQAADSTSVNYDTVDGFASGADGFLLGNRAVASADAELNSGVLSTASFDSDLAAAIGAGVLGSAKSVLFRPDSGTLAGQTFFIADLNDIAGYQASQDLVVRLVNFSGYSASLDAPQVAEGNGGTTAMTFTVTLDRPAMGNVTLSYTTLAGTSALSGTDYTPVSGQVVIADGQTQGVVTVPIVGDTDAEGNETLQLRVTGAALGSPVTGTGTILNDDGSTPITDDDVRVGGPGVQILALDGDVALTTNSKFSGYEEIELGTRRDEDATDGHLYKFVLDNDNAPDAGTTLIIDAVLLAADTDGAGPLVAETLLLDARAVSAFKLDVRGGAADDTIFAGQLVDIIDGGAGNDRIVHLGGADMIAGGAGTDTFQLGSQIFSLSVNSVTDPSAYRIVQVSEAGNAIQTLAHVQGVEILKGGRYAVTPTSAGNFNLATALQGGSHPFQFDGTGLFVLSSSFANNFQFGPVAPAFFVDIVANGTIGSVDTLDFSQFGAGIIMSRPDPTGTGTIEISGGAAIATYTGFPNILGTAFADTLVGSSWFETIHGGAGDDIISGGARDDIIRGGAGADTLTGGPGDDGFQYTAASDSSTIGYDRLPDFDYADDHLTISGTHDTYSAVAGGTLSSASFDADLGAAMSAVLDPGEAIFFSPNAGDLAGKTFLIVDQDGVAGYQANADFVFDVTGTAVPVGPIPDFIFG